ncbi:hypothetical protein FB567DRAFT_598008 [Paraphoma chrysanthemicola]|uniref:Uncharacterized protein n=1 Tax=Paraphoma chrysanthemicola TaxID=798071 RepID=A0A8K0VTD8_9PLEO|nr:hypothetical protein FB567DRAFT_598008 [Paraphoma chrysanthemicola]
MASTRIPASPTIIILVTELGNIQRMLQIQFIQEEVDSVFLQRLEKLMHEDYTARNEPLGNFYRAITMRRIAIGSVSIHGQPDFEAQTVAPYQVKQIVKDRMLTQFLRKPSAVALDTRSIQEYITAGQKVDREEDMQMWCLYYELDGVAASMWLMFALLLAILLGVALEIIIRDIELTLSVGTGLLVVLTTIHSAIMVGSTY